MSLLSVRSDPAQAPKPVEAPTPILPKGGGAVRPIAEKFSANPATGAGSQSIPIPTPPGRGGFGPQLSLGYSSGGGTGLFGIGWGLSVPAIRRKTEKGLPQYLDDARESDTFILSGAEDLVPKLVSSSGNWVADQVTDGVLLRKRYRPRVEAEFARIERITDTASGNVYWQATTKDNVTSTYGKSDTARIADSANPKRIFQWLLERSEDDRGNVVLYQYKAEDLVAVVIAQHQIHRQNGTASFVNRHLKRILYGNKVGVASPSASSDFHFEIVFDFGEHDGSAPTPTDSGSWTARSDAFSSYRAGFEIRTYRLCKRVLVFHRFSELAATPVLTQSTDFTYEDAGSVTYLKRATHKGYSPSGSSYTVLSLPPADFDYSRAVFSSTVRDMDAQSARELVSGPGGRSYQWIDLDGEGAPGVLTEQGGALYFKRNLGQGKLAPPRGLDSKPAGAGLGARARPGQQLLDVTGDGLPDLVDLGRPGAGYHARETDGSFSAHVPFNSVPNVNWSDPSLRFIDLDGDGFADVMVSADHVYTWYPSRRRDGFGPPRQSSRFSNESLGPTAVFAEREQTIFLADMKGDGLQDIVRIRNGSVSYWPNLGYGRFGAMVMMSNAPTFAPSGEFDPSRLRLADIDGSGTTDLLYVGKDGVYVWLNQAGNRFADKVFLAVFPGADAMSSVDVIDLLGSGTSCLVWATPLSGRPPQVRYADLLNSTKPHLLTSSTNGLGLETRIGYTTSAKLYQQDRAVGKTWATRLPFPVQVVARVEQYDHISKLRFVSTYSYRHGFYDGEEREFRGFGYVETRDAETVDQNIGQGLFPTYPVANGERVLPPVVTKSWFHTGAYKLKTPLLDAFAAEFFSGNSSELRPSAPILPSATDFVAGQQTYRALAGKLVRQEVYADDGSADAAKPYVVTQHRYEVRELQPRGSAPFASHLTVNRETLTLQYERNTSDPRILHEMAVVIDALGYTTTSARIAYPRQSGATHTEQQKLWVLTKDDTPLHHVDDLVWYRHGVPISSKSWEVGSALAPASGQLLTLDAVAAATAQAEVAYDITPTSSQKRLLSSTRTRYWKNDLSVPLAFGSVESRALPYQTYGKAFTAAMLSSTLEGRITTAMATNDGGYVDLDADGTYWAQSGRTSYDASAFFLPSGITDPHGNTTTIGYESHKLLVTTVTDALSNVTTADLDFRVLAPKKVTDVNGNFVEAVFDELGRVTKLAVRGKNSEGDTTTDPTIKYTYDLDRYVNSALPARIKTERRETHQSGTTRWLLSYSYLDGTGRETMAKVKTEPGLAPQLDSSGHPVFVGGVLQYASADPRYVGTGRTVLDNKGHPIKQYEPFFSATEEYETDPDIVNWGVTPVLFYDPVGRLTRVDLPNGSYARTTFTPWQQVHYDENDTLLESGNLYYNARIGLTATDPEKVALNKGLAHADTPTTTYFDSMGRPFSVALKNMEGSPLAPVFHETKLALDIQGSAGSMVDALARTCATYTRNMLGGAIAQTSIDAGTRKMFTTAKGEHVKSWGQRAFFFRCAYDALRRKTHTWLDDGSPTGEKLIERLVYGEAHASVVAGNLRGRLVHHYDQSGLVITDSSDFKGNSKSQSRRYAADYKNTVDWVVAANQTDPATILNLSAALLETESRAHAFEYDALNRPTRVLLPDASTTTTATDVRPGYNIAGILESVAAFVRGSGTSTSFVANVDYDEKGRRTKIEYANNTSTAYSYNALTFRLSKIETTRSSPTATLQKLTYTLDAVGNIVLVKDEADWAVILTSSTSISPDLEFTYDAVYRLIEGFGREHNSGTSTQVDEVDFTPVLNHQSDPAGLKLYKQLYSYDKVGSFTSLQHTRPGTGPTGEWTRTYTYASGNNRLATTTTSTGTASYTHDAHGNMTVMPHLTAIGWDFLDRMHQATKSTVENTWFVYDASGERVRKIYEHSGVVEDRRYLGGHEIYRKQAVVGLTTSLVEERHTSHIADDARRVCMVETLTFSASIPPPTTGVPRYRFQLDDHLGTVSLEVDNAGSTITYEATHPYGTSAFRAFKTGVEVSARRYRYTGKERDDETSLYYHGARYYAPWLGRWTAADPMGTVDGTNLFAYVRGSPVNLVDPNGTWGEQPEKAQPIITRADVELLRLQFQLDFLKRAAAKGASPGPAAPPPHVEITRGQLTFEAEGKPGNPAYTLKPYYAGGGGVTIGRGFDLGAFRQARSTLKQLREEGYIDTRTEKALRRIVGKTTETIGKDRKKLGKEGIEKEAGYLANKLHIEISPEAEKRLFQLNFAAKEEELRATLQLPDVAAAYPGVDYDKLDPRIKEMLVELNFVGHFVGAARKHLMGAVQKNDVQEFKRIMSDKDLWTNQIPKEYKEQSGQNLKLTAERFRQRAEAVKQWK